jgi:hypothetical protein
MADERQITDDDFEICPLCDWICAECGCCKCNGCRPCSGCDGTLCTCYCDEQDDFEPEDSSP